MTDSGGQTWLEKIEEDIKRMVGRMPEYEKILALYRDSLIAQGSAKEKLSPVEVDMDENMAAVCAGSNLPLINEAGAELQTNAAVALFKELKEIVARHGEEYAGEMAKIDEAVDSGKLNLGEILEEVFAGGSAEELKKTIMDAGLDGQVFASLVFSSIRPNLELYAEKLRPILDDKDWQKKSCPVCGRLPFMGKLVDKEGVRILSCSACSADWRFPRIKCVNCGIEDQEQLRILYPEGEEKIYYADVCDSCKRYLKAVDAREMTRSPVMQLADAATLHLDLLAQREGFVTL